MLSKVDLRDFAETNRALDNEEPTDQRTKGHELAERFCQLAASVRHGPKKS